MPSFHSEAVSYCRWLTRGSHSNFVTALRLLPRSQQEAMEVVYAFCRAVDDVVDRAEPGGGSGGAERAKQQLQRWRKELADCAAGFPTHPIAVALQPVAERYQIPLRHFEVLIDGVEMDLRPRRYATFEELKVYCEHVASVVGLISVRVFGCRHPAAERYAQSLGIALQLTNILRDLKTDVEQDRVYLPQEEMARFGYSEADLAASRTSDAFRKLMAFQYDRAREFFRQAEQALKESRERRRLLPAQIMAAVYTSLLSRMEQIRYDVFSQRVSVSRQQQLWIAARLWAGGVFS